MAATENQITTVREMLGESIPQGGSEADTMFPDGRVFCDSMGDRPFSARAV